MQPKILSYDIIHARDLDCVSIVNSFIAQGWQPYGTTHFTKVHDLTMCRQVMVKYAAPYQVITTDDSSPKQLPNSA